MCMKVRDLHVYWIMVHATTISDKDTWCILMSRQIRESNDIILEHIVKTNEFHLETIIELRTSSDELLS